MIIRVTLHHRSQWNQLQRPSTDTTRVSAIRSETLQSARLEYGLMEPDHIAAVCDDQTLNFAGG